MSKNTPLTIAARRKWTVLVTFLLMVVATAVISKTLDDVYSASGKLLITVRGDSRGFDSVQASQAIARSYADIIESPNIADRVALRLGETTGGEVGDATSFEAIPDTQLLQITAEDEDPDRAKLIADTYATVFIDYARQNLAASTDATVTLADAAARPDAPSRPRPALYTFVAGVLGLGLGLALALLRERLDRRLRTLDDVEEQFDAPVLARVPHRGRSKPSEMAFKEAMRLLRTNLQFAGGDRLRSVAITSARDGEGKSTIAGSLAAASAEVGARVVAVEGDFRHPKLQRELIPDEPAPLRPGLSNYLIEAAELEDVMFPTAVAGVEVIPAGPAPPSPSALLESRRGPAVAAELAEEADFVVIDTPPLTVGADASVIAQWVDGVIVVIDLNTSTDRAVRQALRQLEAVQAPLLGFVLNRDRPSTPSAYDYAAQSARAKAASVASARRA